MTRQREDAERVRTDERGGQAMKRRGLIAGAATLVAAMVAKQTSQPVAANTDGQALIIAASNSESTRGTSLIWTGGVIGSDAALFVTDGGATTLFTAMVAGIATGSKASNGVYGEGSIGVGGFSDSGYGVSGSSTNNVGVYGSSTNYVGVYGTTKIPPGSGGSGVGVQGQSDAAGGTGVKGASASGFPIIGQVTGGSNTAAGVLGSGTKGPGVQGQSTTGHGLVGTTKATDGHAGLIGNADNAGGIGLMGIAPGYGTMTVGKAGEFFGNVSIHGALTSPVMQAVVPHQGDNTYRLLHGVASPEAWFEDYGKGTLVADKAEIEIDPDFAALVHTNDYLIFLTAYGPQHLHVAQQTATGFTVVATPIGAAQVGGVRRAEGGGTFSWRVMAKRKDIVGERLAKVVPPPPPKVPTAFVIPETPAITPPTKQP